MLHTAKLHTNILQMNKFCINSHSTSPHRVLPFWLLVASLVRGTAMPLMQFPYYQYTGSHFTNLRRMTGWVNRVVLIQWKTGLKLKNLGSQATTQNTKPTPGCHQTRKERIIFHIQPVDVGHIIAGNTAVLLMQCPLFPRSWHSFFQLRRMTTPPGVKSTFKILQ